jgi:BirA family biotin operon repressor/biotin-[acetyl-CoA-carboxylase] ligase
LSGFDAQRFATLAAEQDLGLGQPCSAQSVTGSTNDDAMSAAKAGAPHGALFIADEQTRGRGRRGRQWTSPAGVNLLFSVVLRPQLETSDAQALTLAMGLALRDVLAGRVDVPVGLKWPNDVFAEGRKLAGVLVETQLRGSEIRAVVVGVGVNVGMRALPAGLHDHATSLALLGARDLQLEPLLVGLLRSIDQRAKQYVCSGLQPILPDLLQHDVLRNRRVKVDKRVGTARGIAGDGALIIEDGEGGMHRVLNGSVDVL